MSPTSPFLGQLSVDIGNMYSQAQRLGSGHLRPSAWHSTCREIATEIWRQIREGMDYLRASVLAAPEYYNLDEGLRFDDRRGSSFRKEVSLSISGRRPEPYEGPLDFSLFGLTNRETGLEVTGRCHPLLETDLGNYVVWVNGERFVAAGTPASVANQLEK